MSDCVRPTWDDYFLEVMEAISKRMLQDIKQKAIIEVKG